jgi:hypothetical protein
MEHVSEVVHHVGREQVNAHGKRANHHGEDCCGFECHRKGSVTIGG